MVGLVTKSPSLKLMVRFSYRYLQQPMSTDSAAFLRDGNASSARQPSLRLQNMSSSHTLHQVQ